MELRADLLLAAGRHDELLPSLHDLAVRHPLREPLWRRLMLAQYRAGRQADALASFDAVRVRLRDELGVDPDPELRALRQSILRQDPELQPRRSPAAPVPRQLPTDLPRFCGRDAELAALDRLLETRPTDGGPVLIAVLSGGGGLGKTALAVHWAHRVTSRFGDGQLYLNLRGYGPQPPVPPMVALETLLRSLGVPGVQIPSELDARSGLLRSTLAGRRTLLVLDNARDAEQVRPLLPGAGTMVLVTSRSQLRSLMARDAAHPIDLRHLAPTESVRLLATAAGLEPASSAESGKWVRVAELCGHLPLALAIAGEQLGRHLAGDLDELIAELRDQRERLDTLDAGDPETDVRAVFSWSYRALRPEVARMFRLLALHPGADIGAPAAAALAGVTVPQARRLLDRLVNAHQLGQPRRGRYEQHDLLRAYAAELAESDPDAGAAARRIAEWYRAAADLADTQVRRDRRVATEYPDVTAPFTDRESALAWYDTERGPLVATVRYAADHGLHDVAWELAFRLRFYLHLRHAWDDWIAVSEIGLESARRLGNPLHQARLHNSLGMVHSELRRHQRALDHYRQALALFRAGGHRHQEAAVHTNLGMAYLELGQVDEAIGQHERSRELADRLGDQRGAHASYVNLATALVRAGRHAEAIQRAETALAWARGEDDGFTQAECHAVVGRALLGLGQPGAALPRLREAVELWRPYGNRGYAARVMIDIGLAQRAAGAGDDARQTWRTALEVFTELGDPRADDVRRHLAEPPDGQQAPRSAG